MSDTSQTTAKSENETAVTKKAALTRAEILEKLQAASPIGAAGAFAKINGVSHQGRLTDMLGDQSGYMSKLQKTLAVTSSVEKAMALNVRALETHNRLYGDFLNASGASQISKAIAAIPSPGTLISMKHLEDINPLPKTLGTQLDTFAKLEKSLIGGAALPKSLIIGMDAAKEHRRLLSDLASPSAEIAKLAKASSWGTLAERMFPAGQNLAKQLNGSLAGWDKGLSSFTQLQKTMGVIGPGGAMSDYFSEHMSGADLHKQVLIGSLAYSEAVKSFSAKTDMHAGILSNLEYWKKISAPDPAMSSILKNMEAWDKSVQLSSFTALKNFQQSNGSDSIAKMISEHMSGIELERHSFNKFLEEEKRERESVSAQLDLLVADMSGFKINEILDHVLIGDVDTEIMLPAQFIAYCNLHSIIGLGCRDLATEIKLLESAIKQKSASTSQSVKITLTAIKNRYRRCVETHTALNNVAAADVIAVTPRYAVYVHELWQIPPQLRQLAVMIDQLWPDII